MSVLMRDRIIIKGTQVTKEQRWDAGRSPAEKRVVCVIAVRNPVVRQQIHSVICEGRTRPYQNRVNDPLIDIKGLWIRWIRNIALGPEKVAARHDQG